MDSYWTDPDNPVSPENDIQQNVESFLEAAPVSTSIGNNLSYPPGSTTDRALGGPAFGARKTYPSTGASEHENKMPYLVMVTLIKTYDSD
jgi:hypothetical protein